MRAYTHKCRNAYDKNAFSETLGSAYESTQRHSVHGGLMCCDVWTCLVFSV
jgi:hypothetical protein